MGENIMYGGDTPLEAILSLAIDDGVKSRGHRENMFNPDFYYTGCGTDMHAAFRITTVTTFTGMFTPDTSYKMPPVTVPKTFDEYKS